MQDLGRDGERGGRGEGYFIYQVALAPSPISPGARANLAWGFSRVNGQTAASRRHRLGPPRFPPRNYGHGRVPTDAPVQLQSRADWQDEFNSTCLEGWREGTRPESETAVAALNRAAQLPRLARARCPPKQGNSPPTSSTKSRAHGRLNKSTNSPHQEPPPSTPTTPRYRSIRRRSNGKAESRRDSCSTASPEKREAFEGRTSAGGCQVLVPYRPLR